jgi:tRNA dimethylallyltransferase
LHYETEIISADSRQFFKEMSIGTAKPDSIEQRGVKHHFIDSHSIKEEVSSSRFASEAQETLDQLFKTHEKVILVGGSGMFIDALVDGLDNIPSSVEIRNELIKRSQEDYSILLEELKLKDPKYFDVVDRKNPARVIRALEAIEMTGLPYSQLRTSQKKQRDYRVIRLVIEHERTELYNRINKRVDLMMEKGLLEEVKSLIEYRDRSSLRTVGYRELFDFLDQSTSLEEAIEKIKQNTRNYAKKQLTWLRRYTDSHIIPFDSIQIMKEKCIQIIDNQAHDPIT